ncbi:MAG: hypothetical protein K2K53_09075 [Oscillospiraceae bacterium]|nr:hypothetical protein [Oscillospiraceae bacterium]
MEQAFNAARQVKGKPTAIVLETTKGKGVSHEEYAQGMAELNAALAELEAAV